MDKRKLALYIAAVLLGLLVVAADRLIGWDEGFSYALAGFAGALLLGIGLPFALLSRERLEMVRRVEPVEATMLTANLVSSVAATKLHVIVRRKPDQHHPFVADGPDVVPANGAQSARAEEIEQTH